MSWLVDQGHIDQATHLFLMTWRFWWLRGHLAEFARLGDEIVAGSEDLPPYQRALALTGAGFILIANGDLARAQTLFEQSLPLYRQTSEKLGVVLNATVLAVLGHLAAIRRDYAGASKLLDEGQALVQEFRDEDLTGYDRLQQLLTVALLDNFLGQVRLSQADNDAAARLFTDGLTVARRAHDRIPILVSLYDLALSQPGAGRPGRRGRTPEGGTGHRGRGRRRNKRRLLPRGPGGRRRPAGQPAACRAPARPPRARNWKPAAAAGCTPTCRAPRTTMPSWPRCAPA